jgi:MFS transporter, DHA2 family, multidrug resistance protein
MLTPRIVNNIRPSNVIAIGFLIASIGFGLLTRTGTKYDLAVVATAFAVFSLGLAPVFTLATDLIVGTAPPERAGAAAGISEMSTELGGALGIALLGSVVAFIYRGAVTGALGDGLPPDALAAARDTLGGALSASETLPDEIGAALVTASRRAFVEAFQATAFVSAAIALIAAVVTVRVLGKPQNSGTPSASETEEP